MLVLLSKSDGFMKVLDPRVHLGGRGCILIRSRDGWGGVGGVGCPAPEPKLHLRRSSRPVRSASPGVEGRVISAHLGAKFDPKSWNFIHFIFI